MSRKPRIDLAGTQLAFEDLGPESHPSIDEIRNEAICRRQLDRFQRYIRAEYDHGSARVSTLTAHLMAMVRQGEAVLPTELVTNTEWCIRAITKPQSCGAKRDRFTTLQYFHRSHSHVLGSFDRWSKLVLKPFAGRMSPRDDLADVNFGGTRKHNKLPPLISWETHHRLIEAVNSVSRPENHKRDKALMALHLRSSFKPSEIDLLEWNHLFDPLTEPGDSAEYREFSFKSTKGVRDVVVHVEAFAFLTDHWKSEGSPSNGAVFKTVKHARSTPLTASRVGQILRAVADHLGMKRWDRRNLRAAFAVWLDRVVGWDDYVIKRRFGLVNIQIVKRMKQPVEEMLAQMQVREIFGIEIGPTVQEPMADPSRTNLVPEGGGGSIFSQV